MRSMALSDCLLNATRSLFEPASSVNIHRECNTWQVDALGYIWSLSVTSHACSCFRHSGRPAGGIEVKRSHMT